MIVNKLIDKYGTNNIRDLLSILGISVEYICLNRKTVDSRLIIDQKGDATIFISSEIEDSRYINFLLAHELGHYILHYDKDVSFSFISRVYKTRLENEANLFACKLLLHDINIKLEDNIQFVAMDKGIPLKIWYSVIEKMKEDVTFQKRSGTSG